MMMNGYARQGDVAAVIDLLHSLQAANQIRKYVYNKNTTIEGALCSLST
jgi:pentatricopeptide repeat protein